MGGRLDGVKIGRCGVKGEVSSVIVFVTKDRQKPFRSYYKRCHRGVSGVRRLSLGAGHGHGVEVGWFGVEWGDERR